MDSVAPDTAIDGQPRDVGRRDFLIGALLLGTAGVAFARLPRTPVVALGPVALDSVIPSTIGPWQLIADDDLVRPPDDERKAASVYEDELSRTYVRADGAAVMFLIAYARSQSGMLMVHRPESCYPGSGFTITADRAITVPLAAGLAPGGRFLSTERGERIEQVLYWTRLGNDFPIDWDSERQELARQNLRGLIPDGALVRLSIISPDPQGSLALLREFAADVFRASGRDGRALLAGPANA